MQCPKCQHENPDGMKFCIECGASLKNRCANCGFENLPQAKFCGECGAPLVQEMPQEVAAPPRLEDMHEQLQSMIPEELARKYMAAEQEATGENRPITALFADISGFTPLSNTQSSETMFRLVQNCFRQLVGIVARYEGSISGFRGDGLLALFGAPILHENDAERAILAAMDMHRSMQEQQLQVSIGINTAMMTVGEIQTQLHKEYTAYGTDVNLAKRLQEAAQPGQILAGTGTHRLTRRIFDFDILSRLSVRGFQQPVTAYVVKQVKEHPEKLRGIEGLRARMIGREHEFAEMKEAADEWLGGQGQIVSIIGEAGIGKSRLVRELREYLGERGGEGASVSLSVLEGRCVSIGQPISYWPFRDILRTYFGLSEEDDEPTRACKVTESIIGLMLRGADEALPLLGNLLSIKFGNELDDRLKFASPEQIRHQTLMRLRDIFRTLAEQQPLLLILEDLHWSDDLSLDLVSLLMDELANSPLLMLCVYRPERDHRVWQLGDQARRKCLDRYTELILNPLSSHQSRLLVESLLEIDNLPESVKGMMLEKSEGNPFFIEEVIRSLIEQDVVYLEDDRWKARDEIANIHVPDTIQSVVLARVDRLQEEAKYVLRCASVIGRLFRYRLLQHISHQERDLDRYLSDFEEKELVYEERTVPELEYAFKHAFTQEATYEGILEQRRREFHHQVAQGIERLYQERLDEYYEELAHHYSRSADAGKAVEYLLKAGEKAKGSYANEIAISNYRKALEILEQHGPGLSRRSRIETIERNDWKLEALSKLGEVYLGMGRMAESREAYEQAITLAKSMGVPPRQLVRLYHWITEVLYWQSQFDEMLHYGQMGLEILGDDTQCLEAVLMNDKAALGYGMKGGTMRGRFQEYVRRNIKLIKNVEYSPELRPVYHRIYHLITYRDGDPELAWEWSRDLETRAEQHHDLRGVATAWSYQGQILEAQGDYESALLHFQKSLEMFQSIGDDKHVNMIRGGTADARSITTILLDSGHIEEAEAQIRVFLKAAEDMGVPFDIAWAHEQLGNIAMCQHCWEEAISHYRECLDEYQSTGNPYFISRGHIRLGRACMKKGDHRQAIRSFEKAALSGSLLTDDLGAMEEAYAYLDTWEVFVEFCRSLKEQHTDWMKRKSFHQWYLEQGEPSEEFSHLAFADDFDTPAATQSKEFETETVDPSWSWVDKFGDCAYRIIPAGGLEICAANGRELDGINLSAPRFVREISGDFAVEVCMSPASDEKPQIGGLVVWKDRGNFLRFEKGIRGLREVFLDGYIDREWQFFAGRGLLPEDSRGEVHLRLERVGDEFSAYCSVNAESWLKCGTLVVQLDDPIQIGIHTIGMIDRTIYCGAYKEGTATVFRNFRIWTRG